jgi:16S rRNA (guanine527-N7)-methyltransferase
MTENGSVGHDLPAMQRAEFDRRLRGASPLPLSDETVGRLYLHFCELRRWNRRFSLIGSGTRHQILERHYGESLCALPLLEPRPGTLVDIGTGGGFPGLVLALARPDIEVTLVEASEHKWSFLMTVCRKLSLACRCVNARVDSARTGELPRRIDWITSRAVRTVDLGLAVLLPKLRPNGTMLLWLGATDPELPPELRRSRQVALPESRTRRIVEFSRSEPTREKK